MYRTEYLPACLPEHCSEVDLTHVVDRSNGSYFVSDRQSNQQLMFLLRCMQWRPTYAKGVSSPSSLIQKHTLETPSHACARHSKPTWADPGGTIIIIVQRCQSIVSVGQVDPSWQQCQEKRRIGCKGRADALITNNKCRIERPSDRWMVVENISAALLPIFESADLLAGAVPVRSSIGWTSTA